MSSKAKRIKSLRYHNKIHGGYTHREHRSKRGRGGRGLGLGKGFGNRSSLYLQRQKQGEKLKK